MIRPTTFLFPHREKKRVEPMLAVGRYGNELAVVAIYSSLNGCMPEAEIKRVVMTFGERLCLAKRGDIWLYATLGPLTWRDVYGGEN